MKRDASGMELDVWSVQDRETFSFHQRFPVPLGAAGVVECDATVSGSLVKTGSRLMLNAAVAGHVNAECSRCLRRFDMPVEAGFELVFHRGERAPVPYGVDEEDFIGLPDAAGGTYDLFPRVRESIILELPIQFLCTADCRGLCVTCGANLNDGECGCSQQGDDPCWDALRGLFKDRESE